MSNLHKKRYIKILFISFICIFILLALTASLLTTRDRSIFLSKANKISFEGVERSYVISEPKKTDVNTKMIFAFHGLGSNGKQMAYVSGLHNSADKNTIIVYPEALKSSNPTIRPGWNAGFCCGSGWRENNNDIGFIKELVTQLSKKYSLDASNIYAVGFSNGAMFVQKIAEQEPALFAGYASIAGSIGTKENSLKPTQAVNILQIHGLNDKIVPFYGGVGSADTSFIWESFEETVNIWENVNACTENDKNIDQSLNKEKVKKTAEYEHTDCQKKLKIIVNKDDGHKWPDWRLFNIWNRETTGSAEVIDFFNSL